MNREIIICSAIKTRDGLIIRGHRHSDCIRTMETMKLPPAQIELDEQGFMTSKNRFVDRWQAFRIAKKAEQVKSNYDVKELFSEDLY